MPVITRKKLSALVLVLVAFFIYRSTGGVSSPAHSPEGITLAGPILAILFLYICYLFPVIVWLAIALVTFSPVFLYQLLSWLFRRYKRAESEVYQPLPDPVAPPKEKPVPLMQRRFRH